jgi:hypothetical protein
MQKTVMLAAALAVSFAALAAEQLNVKTGAWEITMNTSATGTPPIPEETLAKMSAEQRAKLEAMFASSATPRTHKSTECVTKEDLAKPFHPDEDDKCQTTVIKSTGSTQDISVICKGDHPSTGRMHVEASSPESMTGTIDISVENGKSPMQIKTQMSGRWIGPACKKDD